MDVEGGDSTKESDLVKEGGRITDPAETPAGKRSSRSSRTRRHDSPLTLVNHAVGLLVCFDLRFPAPAMVLRRKGAQILAYNSAFTARTGPPHWEVLLRARAIENQAYVLAANQVSRARLSALPRDAEHCSVDPSIGWDTPIRPAVIRRCDDRFAVGRSNRALRRQASRRCDRAEGR